MYSFIIHVQKCGKKSYNTKYCNFYFVTIPAQITKKKNNQKSFHHLSNKNKKNKIFSHFLIYYVRKLNLLYTHFEYNIYLKTNTED